MRSFWNAFAEIAKKYPSAVAIRDRGIDLSYADLLKRAAATGERLKAEGIGAETLIGLKIEKSSAYVIALLGTWYAGAAFVPLPPSLPQERQDYIAGDAGIRHFLTASDTAAATETFAPAAISTETLAYVIYTSGSTGRPKGVMVEHRGIMNLLEAQGEYFSVGPGSRSLLYLSVNFDASLSDLGVALVSGATLVIRPQEELQDGASLLRVLKDEAITHIDMPPALLKALDPAAMPETLKTIIIGGEASAPETVRAWAAKFRVINVYGPTEATVCTGMNLCDAATWERPLMGRTLPGVVYDVIDGELQIGGGMLARGYLNRPDLTAEKFIMRSGQRFYRSGDKVRAHADGSIEFIGRLDRQFKLRGQLVEPDEVEARLQEHPQVMKAAVIKREEQLVAFVSLSDRAIGATLPAYLSRFLPGWMIPQRFEIVARLPLTATGKTDYAALAAMPLSDGARACIAPRTETEQKLWNAWRITLKHDNFGVTDAFYGVGGDSLGIIRLTLEAERQGLAASAGIFARHATIEEQALHLSASPALSAAWLRQDVAFGAADNTMLAAAARRPPVAKSVKNILLTGATGFLGSRVLRELLAETEAVIYCLVRAPDERGALQRLEDAARKFGMALSAADRARIVPVTGDLSRLMAGLGTEQWRMLADSIDAIYHCAACVNITLSYPDMRAANTGAALTLLRLACEGKRKTFHNASTLSVFVATDRNSGVLRESDRLEETQTVYGGYAQTKYAAEYMLSQAPAAACAVTHYRFGLLTGDAASGRGAPFDLFAMVARGIATLGAVPAGYEEKLQLDVTPVCYAARAMVRLSLQGAPGVYHIANSQPLSLQALCAALAARGRPIQPLPPERWLDLVKNKPLSADESAAVLALCRAFPDGAGFMRHRTMDLFQATGVTFDTARADAVLRPAGILCPAVGGRLICAYLDDFFKEQKPLVKICLFGPESTGKSTLAEKLARHYGAGFVAEYARDHIAARAGDITAADIPQIAAGQVAAEARATAGARGLLLCDTDLLTTVIWSERLFDDCPQWIRDAAACATYDLYLLMDVNAPWVDDVHRCLPEERESFLALCRGALDEQKRPYVFLTGGWEQKFTAACAAIDTLADKRLKEAA